MLRERDISVDALLERLSRDGWSPAIFAVDEVVRFEYVPTGTEVDALISQSVSNAGEDVHGARTFLVGPDLGPEYNTTPGTVFINPVGEDEALPLGQTYDANGHDGWYDTNADGQFSMLYLRSSSVNPASSVSLPRLESNPNLRRKES
tara:strand:+ start:61030 stop:61473 length:444 start_codon:yes stop_codon:yes gene_type:complete